MMNPINRTMMCECCQFFFLLFLCRDRPALFTVILCDLPRTPVDSWWDGGGRSMHPLGTWMMWDTSRPSDASRYVAFIGSTIWMHWSPVPAGQTISGITCGTLSTSWLATYFPMHGLLGFWSCSILMASLTSILELHILCRALLHYEWVIKGLFEESSLFDITITWWDRRWQTRRTRYW